MITFRPMPSLVRSISQPRIAVARRRWLIAMLGAALTAATPALLCAQVYPSHTEDAAPVPKGVLRMKVTTVWTRYDERFTATGTRPLARDRQPGTPTHRVAGFPLEGRKGKWGNLCAGLDYCTMAKKEARSGRQPRRLSRDLMDPSARLEMDWEAKRVPSISLTGAYAS